MMRGPALVKRYECGHREIAGSYSRRPQTPTEEAFCGIDLSCVGLCRQCRASLCDHPRPRPRKPESLVSVDTINALFEQLQLEAL